MKVAEGYGQRVAMVRDECGQSMQAFARGALSAGASAKNIGRIEAEEVVPTVRTLTKVAVYGGVSFNWLLTGKLSLKPHDIVTIPGVGQRIQLVRESRGLSRLALSRRAKLGESSKNISRLETIEHRPRLSTVRKIAKVLKVPASSLLYGVAN
jgi:transcriptional regulator with XRE-family HTH domain